MNSLIHVAAQFRGMLEEFISFLFHSVLGTLFFHLGRFYLWLFTLGRISGLKAGHRHAELVALFGLLLTFTAGLLIAVYIHAH
jgi:hypothetical protein